jgi:pimeloyl-ACP methyl ester carboxylesterase
VVSLDLPGHGLSPCEDASIDSAAAALLEIQKSAGPIFAAVGHSYGCAVIVHAIGKGLAVDRVALLATPIPRTQPRRWLEADAEPAVVARANAIREEYARAETGRVEAAIAAMTARCLAIHSIDDEQTPLSNAQRLVDLWPGADLMLADGLGHRFVAQDGDVLQRMAEFIG